MPDNARIMITQGIANGAIKTMKALRYDPELVYDTHIRTYLHTSLSW
jgi:hypothetical protein